jgi:hypothetical protein
MSGAATVPSQITGILHILVAFDWGEEVSLDDCLKLAPSELHLLSRSPRTPSSIQYRPLPLRFRLQPDSSATAVPGLPREGIRPAAADATVFDFGAVSVALHIPLELSGTDVARIAGGLWDSAAAVEAARGAVRGLFEKLKPCIRKANWRELTEEYVVFEFPPQPGLPDAAQIVQQQSDWLAGLLRLESARLSDEEIQEAVRSRISYSPHDLVIVDWAGAVAVGGDHQDVLDVLAFANLQLLEFRQIDEQLDRQLDVAWGISQRLSQTRLPFWRTHARDVRALGAMKIDAHGMFERTTNSLKLVGDPYLARVYHLVAGRFHLEEWSRNVRVSLSVLESIYEALTQQSATYRAEFLELTIIVLILYEIIAATLGW